MPQLRRPLTSDNLLDRSSEGRITPGVPSKAPAKVPATTRVAPPKQEKNLRDHNAVNERLINRGDIGFQMSAAAVLSWTRTGQEHKIPQVVIDAINLLGTILNMPYRQREGLARTIARDAGIDLKLVPTFSALARRAKGVTLPVVPLKGPVVISMDSTGISVHPGGAWRHHKHGGVVSQKWVKWHVTRDVATGLILAETSTWSAGAGSGDCTQGVVMTKEAGENYDVTGVLADGAYDRKTMYEAAASLGAALITPPRTGAVYGLHPDRDRNMAQIGRLGLDVWKDRVGYGMRALSEGTFSQTKYSFGDSTRAKTLEGAKADLTYRAMAVNHWIQRELDL